MKKPSGNIFTSLIYRKINNELNEEEMKLFQAWLKESPEHVAYFEKMKHYQEQELTGEVSEDEIDEAWGLFMEKTKIHKLPGRRKNRIRWTAVAAMIILAVGIGSVWNLRRTDQKPIFTSQESIVPGQRNAILELADGSTYHLGNLSQPRVEGLGTNIIVDSCRLSYLKVDSVEGKVMQYNKLIVPRGGEFQLCLEDGTKVWLNSESRLTYPQFFIGSKREVYLEGEAYFEVTENPDRPFIVYSGIQKITVLGTSFGITNYAGESGVSTTLVGGEVVAEYPGVLQQTYRLKPGERIFYDFKERKVSQTNVDVWEYVAWKDGKYVFTRKRLEEMLTTLSRWYDFRVFFQNPEAKEILFSGELKRFDRFDDILRLIEKTSDVRFTTTANTVIVTK